MKLIFIGLIVIYFGALAYIYFTQNMQIFNAAFIKEKESFIVKNMENISLHVDENVRLEGVYKKSSKKDAPLVIYFGGNADDATRILLHVKSLDEVDILSFNYRGYVKSSGKPSEKALFGDALRIYDEYAKDKKVILIGRSLGTGVASYLASKREVAGVILITPYDSIVSIAKRKYPIFPIDILLRHKFESTKYISQVKAPVSLIEVKDDNVITKWHFDKIKEKVPNLSKHVLLENTTHGEVLEHPLFEEKIKEMIEKF